MLILRVNDKLFYTTQNLLEKMDFFQILFKTRNKIDKDKDGNIFINRKSDYFDYILDFAKGYENDIDKLSKKELRTLNDEVTFYGYQELQFKIDKLLKTSNQKNKNKKFIHFFVKYMGCSPNRSHNLYALYTDGKLIDIFRQSKNIKKMEIDDFIMYINKHMHNKWKMNNDNIFINNNAECINIYILK